MRHNFVNDIGDYAKYALLRAFCVNAHPPLKLGVIWYLTDHEEQNTDGRRRPHLSNDGWDTVDPELLLQMRAIESQLQGIADLHLNLIEQSEVLPPDTVYFSKPLPAFTGSYSQRIAQRAEWFANAKQATAGCNLLFLDPDNGLEVKSVRPGSRFAGKYVTLPEIAELTADGALVILYQHCDRSPWRAQRAKIHDQLVAGIGPQLYIRSVRFGAFGARAFFCLTTDPTMATIINIGLDTLAKRVANWDRVHTFRFE
ncbi:MAG TPA: hypothetical protein VKS82_03115 [Streptosporangiaceae bacterium]|nr:hypothetical protein [Streptosporangiaceae bacterium]